MIRGDGKEPGFDWFYCLKLHLSLENHCYHYIVAENQQLLGNAGIAEIAVQTAQNTRDIADHSVNIRELFGEVHNVQDRLGRIDLNLQKVMENFIDPSTYKHFLILNGHKLEDIEGYRPMFEELWAQKTPL